MHFAYWIMRRTCILCATQCILRAGHALCVLDNICVPDNSLFAPDMYSVRQTMHFACWRCFCASWTTHFVCRTIHCACWTMHFARQTMHFVSQTSILRARYSILLAGQVILHAGQSILGTPKRPWTFCSLDNRAEGILGRPGRSFCAPGIHFACQTQHFACRTRYFACQTEHFGDPKATLDLLQPCQ